MKKILRKVLPWVFAAAIFYFLFRQSPPKEILSTIWQANIPYFVVLSIAYFFIIMLLDCVGLQWAFGRYSTKVTFSETILMRGATYLLMLINYNLGQGGMAFYLKRTHKAPVFKSLGTIFFLTCIDLGLILTFGMVAVLRENIVYREISMRHSLTSVTLVFYFCFVLIALAPRLRFPPFHWLSKKHLLVAFQESRLIDYARVIGLRLPVIVIILLANYFLFQSFRSHLPMTDIMAYSPIIAVVGTLPITPSGIGTTQALAIEFFRKSLSGPLITEGIYSAGQIILASSLLWVFFNFALKALFGLFCIHKKSKSLFEETPV